MKNFLLTVCLLFLIGLGGVSTWVIIDPAGVKAKIGLGEKEEDVVSAEARMKADLGSRSSREVAQADRKAGTVDRKARRPPQRGEEAAAGQPADQVNHRRATYVGPFTASLSNDPPPEELYPFRINKRTFPDQNTVNVEIILKNVSGNFWKTAYIVLRPLDGRRGEQFKISDWGIDQFIALDYTFPKDQLTERMSKLRIVSVTGEIHDSALARTLNATRAKAAQELSAGAASMRLGPGSVSAPGLLGLLASASQPMTGLSVQVLEMKDMEAPIEFRLPHVPVVPETLPVSMETTTEARTRAMIHFEDAHEAAFAAESTIREIAREVTRLGYPKAKEATVPPLVLKLRRHLGELNAAGVDLATQARRGNDRDVRELDRIIGQYSSELVAQIESVEMAIRAADPAFRIIE